MRGAGGGGAADDGGAAAVADVLGAAAAFRPGVDWSLGPLRAAVWAFVIGVPIVVVCAQTLLWRLQVHAQIGRGRGRALPQRARGAYRRSRAAKAGRGSGAIGICIYLSRIGQSALRRGCDRDMRWGWGRGSATFAAAEIIYE